MEFAAGGDLFDYVISRQGGKLEEDEARSFFQQLICAVDYMHHKVPSSLHPAASAVQLHRSPSKPPLLCLSLSVCLCLSRSLSLSVSLCLCLSSPSPSPSPSLLSLSPLPLPLSHTHTHTHTRSLTHSLTHSLASDRLDCCCGAQQGVANRDIKLENVLLTNHDKPLLKICDFGYSKATPPPSPSLLPPKHWRLTTATNLTTPLSGNSSDTRADHVYCTSAERPERLGAKV